MPKEVLVIFYDGNIYRVQQLLAYNGADSTNPEDYLLPNDYIIIAVFLGGSIGNIYMNGVLQVL